MPRHVAIQRGRLYPQPDYSIQIDKEGKWTVTQVYLCHRNSAVALMPRPDSVHPDVPFVAVSQATTQVTEGDLAEVTCTYTGAEAKEEDDGSPYVKVYQQSDIEHWAQLWTGENLGAGARVYKKHEDYENIFKFRTVRGDYGINQTETWGEVEIDFHGKNVGEPNR